jgi:hypothetical protein
MGQATMCELKRAARQFGVTSTTSADADAIDARWAPVVRQAKQEARQLAGELTPEQVRARTGQQRDASYAPARYRAGQLLQRALEG